MTIRRKLAGLDVSEQLYSALLGNGNQLWADSYSLRTLIPSIDSVYQLLVRMGTMPQSLTALLQRSSIDDHEEIIKACNAILKKSRSDVATQRVKIVALLKLDRFHDAIRVIEEGGDTLKQKAALEWAYALYKIGSLEEATEIAARSMAGRGAEHVEAQATYRAERFDRTREIYQNLFGDKSASAQERTDLRINFSATQAQRHWAGCNGLEHITKPDPADLDTFEMTYNIACEHIAGGDLEEARLLLGRAKELCESSEDLTADDKLLELFPITVQQIFIALRQGNAQEAESLIESLDISKIEESSTKIIAQSDCLLSRRNSNPYLVHKHFNTTSRPGENDSDRLFSYQSNILMQNSYAIDLLVQKYDGVIRSTSKKLSEQSSASLSPRVNLLSVFNAAARTQGEKGKAAIRKLAPFAETRPHDLGLILVLVQLHVTDGNINSAITVLESFLDQLEKVNDKSALSIRFNPGIVNILISLYKAQNRKRQVNAELSQAARYWQKEESTIQPISLLRAAAISLFNSHNSSDLALAAQIFARLHSLNKDDHIATAGFVASHAISSPSHVESSVTSLRSVQELIPEVDTGALEEAGIAVPLVSASGPTLKSKKVGKRQAVGDDGLETRRNKRVRKLKNKDQDPNQKPDPERWLPLKDRSSYRPKGRKGKQKAADRTQGGIVNEKVEEANASSVVQRGSGQAGSGGGKKKKAKGKR
ncbi:Signal recognition particle core component [Myotisia sp. PD_48]|nr:Signal recognition particle core component [Myotisia sp. PD_48]